MNVIMNTNVIGIAEELFLEPVVFQNYLLKSGRFVGKLRLLLPRHNHFVLAEQPCLRVSLQSPHAVPFIWLSFPRFRLFMSLEIDVRRWMDFSWVTV